MDFASHKLECADLRKSFSVRKAARRMRDVGLRTCARVRMKLRADADEWKSDALSMRCTPPSRGAALPASLSNELVCTLLEGSAAFTRRLKVGAASDATHLDAPTCLEGTRVPRFRAISAASVTAIFSMSAKRRSPRKGRRRRVARSRGPPWRRFRAATGKAKRPCRHMPYPRRPKRLPADSAT